MTTAKVEEQIAQLEQKMKEQQSQSIRDAQSAQEAQLKLTQQLQEAQNVAQSTKGMTQNYERQLAEVHEQMKALEHLLIEQRQKGNLLSSELSAAQDRIGGAERRAQQLQTENEAIKSELKYWNDLYENDVAVENVGENIVEVESAPKSTLPVASDGPVMPSSSGIAASSENVGFTMPTFSSWSWPHISAEKNVPIIAPVRGFDVPLSNAGLDTPPLFPPQQRSRRESFGSTIAGSSGTGGNGNGGRGHGHTGVSGVTPSALPTASVFKMDIKPKEPPVFRGTAAEDVDTWLAKVEDFIYLTEANTRQQVAYMATLLQDAAGDWWTALLKERHGSRPADYTEMSALLRKRFGSSTRVDRARAALRNIKQSTNENVRAYSTRFESLLAKLPSFDVVWAQGSRAHRTPVGSSSNAVASNRVRAQHPALNLG